MLHNSPKSNKGYAW